MAVAEARVAELAAEHWHHTAVQDEDAAMHHAPSDRGMSFTSQSSLGAASAYDWVWVLKGLGPSQGLH